MIELLMAGLHSRSSVVSRAESSTLMPSECTIRILSIFPSAAATVSAIKQFPLFAAITSSG
jgi:hypothetical protein